MAQNGLTQSRRTQTLSQELTWVLEVIFSKDWLSQVSEEEIILRKYFPYLLSGMERLDSTHRFEMSSQKVGVQECHKLLLKYEIFIIQQKLLVHRKHRLLLPVLSLSLLQNTLFFSMLPFFSLQNASFFWLPFSPTGQLTHPQSHGSISVFFQKKSSVLPSPLCLQPPCPSPSCPGLAPSPGDLAYDPGELGCCILKSLD